MPRPARNQYHDCAHFESRAGDSADPALHPKPILDLTTGQPFSGNTIPSSRLNPIALNVLKLTPAPNQRSFPC